MISTEMKILLEFIRLMEGGPGPRGYGQIYGGAKGVSPKTTDVSKMTLKQVLELQDKMKSNGSASTACGGYQFIKKTLIATIQQMKLDISQVWSSELQDKMAVFLMRGRGLDKYMSGAITAETFCNNLAMEWASLPVVTGMIGAQKFVLKPGQSYYAGDGLNKSHHDPKDFLALVRALRSPSVVTIKPDPIEQSPTTSTPAPEPTRPPSYEAPRGLWAWLKSWFA